MVFRHERDFQIRDDIDLKAALHSLAQMVLAGKANAFFTGPRPQYLRTFIFGRGSDSLIEKRHSVLAESDLLPMVQSKSFCFQEKRQAVRALGSLQTLLSYGGFVYLLPTL